MEAYNGPRALPFLIGKYRCEKYLGGGMADVYQARDTELPRDVAIKILKPESQGDEEFLTAFEKEAELAAQCHHDNVVTIYDRGIFEGKTYIVMEFLHGDSLHTLIRNHALGGLKRILEIALHVAEALKCIHGHKVVYRDLKPLNLHVEANGRVKLVDFGIAKSIGAQRTAIGLVKGTPYYMSPEQMEGRPASFRSDIWAFGVVLFEMLTSGTLPFLGSSIDEIAVAVVKSTPNYQLLSEPGVPESVQRIVKRCLVKKPEERYASFDQVVQEIKNALQEFEVTDSGTETSSPRPAVLLWLAVSTGVLVCGAVSAYFYRASQVRDVQTHTAVVAAPSLPKALPAELHFASGDMELVPGGPALLGKDKHTVDVPQFYIDKTEVSKGAYAEFLRQENKRRADDLEHADAEYPAVNVSFYEAQKFAKWAGKRLPTVEEWEKAARGTNGQAFPWGDEADASKANVGENLILSKHGPMPVNSFPQGASPFGALNMCGNVWEWINLPHKPSPEYLRKMMKGDPSIKPDDVFYTIKGGYYMYKPLSTELIWDDSFYVAKSGSPRIGFRCAFTPVSK